MIKYLKILYRLLVYLINFTFFSGDIKKKKKGSENDQKKALKMTS